MRELHADRGRGRGARVARGLALALVTLALAAGAARAEFPGAEFDRIVRKTYPDGGPGCVAVVMKDGVILHSTCAGLADVASKRPFTLDTRTDLASCSKAFTAMAALVLVERGKLSLTGDVRDSLPELDRARYTRPIPLSNLLGMTAGLPGYEDLFDGLADVDNAQVAKALGAVDPAFSPGKRYDYSNAAYAMAALVVERAAGEPFARFVKREVIDRAGMKNTLVMDRPGLEIPERFTGYRHARGRLEPTRNDTMVMGDGQVVTSARDLVAWDRALRARALVKRELMEQAFTPGKLKNGDATEYGFGWSVYQQDGARWIEHSGGWNGIATFIRIYLEGGPSIAILSNDEDSDPSALADELDPLLRQ